MTTQFLSLLLSLLSRVLDGSVSYTELQKFVDEAVIEDKLPEELPLNFLKDISNLQTDLELIAAHQSTYANSRYIYSLTDIVDRLRKYEDSFIL